MFNIMLIVKKDALLKLTVYDNWDIQYCKQHISDLFTGGDKNNLANLPVRQQNQVTGDKLYATYISNKSLFNLNGYNRNHIQPNVGSKF